MRVAGRRAARRLGAQNQRGRDGTGILRARRAATASNAAKSEMVRENATSEQEGRRCRSVSRFKAITYPRFGEDIV